MIRTVPAEHLSAESRCTLYRPARSSERGVCCTGALGAVPTLARVRTPRRVPERPPGLRVSVLLLISCAAVALWLVHTALTEAATNARLDLSSPTTSALVEESSQRGDPSVRVRFEAPDLQTGEQVLYRTEIASPSLDPLTRGEVVRLAYDPTDPRVARLASELDRPWADRLLLGARLLGAGVILGVGLLPLAARLRSR